MEKRYFLKSSKSGLGQHERLSLVSIQDCSQDFGYLHFFPLSNFGLTLIRNHSRVVEYLELWPPFFEPVLESFTIIFLLTFFLKSVIDLLLN